MAIEHERRALPRIRPSNPLYVDYPDMRPRARDVSLSGAYIEDTRPLPPGRMLRLRLWFDDRNVITVNAMVRRIHEGVGMGVEFLTISDDDRNRLRQFVGTPARVERLQSF